MLSCSKEGTSPTTSAFIGLVIHAAVDGVALGEGGGMERPYCPNPKVMLLPLHSVLTMCQGTDLHVLSSVSCLSLWQVRRASVAVPKPPCSSSLPSCSTKVGRLMYPCL
jgi:hypothetical protein